MRRESRMFTYTDHDSDALVSLRQKSNSPDRVGGFRIATAIVMIGRLDLNAALVILATLCACSSSEKTGPNRPAGQSDGAADSEDAFLDAADAMSGAGGRRSDGGTTGTGGSCDSLPLTQFCAPTFAGQMPTTCNCPAPGCDLHAGKCGAYYVWIDQPPQFTGNESECVYDSEGALIAATYCSGYGYACGDCLTGGQHVQLSCRIVDLPDLCPSYPADGGTDTSDGAND